MKNLKKFSSYVCVVLAISMAFSGCGNVDKVKTKSAEIKYAAQGTYPLECSDVLTVWSNSLPVKDANNDPLGLAWKKQTGVNVEFEQPMEGSNESLSLLVASGDLPDIIIGNLYRQTGGIQKFVDDDVIIAIDEHFEYAPNLKNYLDKNPEIDKMVKSDSGSYYVFPFIRGDEKLTVSSGPAIRKDLLTKGGLEIPETIDEWYNALKYFRDNGASAPLSYDLLYWEGQEVGVFIGAYGARAGFYLEGGNVKYGLLEPGFKEGLANLNKWYSEGLIDKNIVKVTGLDSNILNSDTAATCLWAGSGIGKYLNAMKDKDPKFDLSPAPYPVLNKGDKPKFGSKEFMYNPGNNGFITTACKNIELAMRFLDYGYSEKGHYLFNFGVEGESYEMVDNYPKYTDIIMKNPEGLSISESMKKYMLSMTSGPFVQDVRYIEQYYALQQQKDALEVWADTDVLKYNIPMVSFTNEESQKLSSIMNNVKTSVDERIFKYIMGIESLDTYDNMIKEIKALGIDEAIEIYTEAVQRFNKR